MVKVTGRKRGRPRKKRKTEDEEKETEDEQEDEENVDSQKEDSQREDSQREDSQKEDEDVDKDADSQKDGDSPDEPREDEVKEEEVEKSEVELDLDASWEMVEKTHSDIDFTPFIALFFFGMRVHGGKEGEQEALETAAKVFRLDEDQVLGHLSEFNELKNKAKRRKKGKK